MFFNEGGAELKYLIWDFHLLGTEDEQHDELEMGKTLRGNSASISWHILIGDAAYLGELP